MTFHLYMMIGRWIRNGEYFRKQLKNIRLLIYLLLILFVFFSQFIFSNKQQVQSWLGGKNIFFYYYFNEFIQNKYYLFFDENNLLTLFNILNIKIKRVDFWCFCFNGFGSYLF